MNKATEEHQCQWKLFYVLEFRREVEIPKSEKMWKSCYWLFTSMHLMLVHIVGDNFFPNDLQNEKYK